MTKYDHDNLYLSKNERLGIVILFVLLLILIFLPWLYQNKDPLIFNNDYKLMPINEHQTNPFKDSINNFNYKNIEFDRDPSYQTNSKDFELFEFDPNNLTQIDARRLGIKDKSFMTLQKYLNTGATIKTPKEFAKIYGIDEETYLRLNPYIKIKIEIKPFTTDKMVSSKPRNLVNLNNATLEELIPLPGIAEKLATRIIKYRDLLGGFINKSQLNEVYGLQDSTIKKFIHMISINGPVEKIHLNDQDYATLKRHPYIGSDKARIISEYRKQHPDFNDVSDLYKIEALDSNWIQRIELYLQFN